MTERRKVENGPDSAWVATLKEGDAVAYAEMGREIGSPAVVLRRTPGGVLKVGQPGTPLRDATAFYGSSPDAVGRRAYMAGYRVGGTCYTTPRYLVPVAAASTREETER